MGTYTEHKIKAALGSEDSRLYVTAADDSFTTNPGFNPTQFLTEFVSNTNFDTPMINAKLWSFASFRYDYFGTSLSNFSRWTSRRGPSRNGRGRSWSRTKYRYGNPVPIRNS